MTLTATAVVDRCATRIDGDPELAGDERAVLTDDGEVRAIYEVHAVSELAAELVRDPRVLDRARQILGSPFPRTNLHVVFSTVENLLSAPFAGGEPWPPYVANRDGQPLRR